MRVILAIVFTLGACAPALGEVPDIDSFRPVPQFPDPAPGATRTAGTADSSDGRLVLWDGDAVYQQERVNNVNGPMLEELGMGYLGEPSFVALSSNNRRVFLGSGPDALVYDIPDVRDVEDFVTGEEFDVVTFFSGALLNDSLLILDRVRDDLTASEIVVVDIVKAKAGTMGAILAVLQKPAGSSPANVFVDRNSGRTYLMDATTRELRWFSTSALVNAYTTATPLAWTTGTAVGTPGQFLNGGVYGVNPDGEAILGGDEGLAGTGGIQYVSLAAPASIVDTLDPAGTGPAYSVIYSRARDLVLGIDPSVSPPVAYASTDFIPFIPPDSPCADFDEIDLEFAAFAAAYAPGNADLDGDTIRDSAMLELVELFSCRANATSALAFSTNEAYDNNREVFALEGNAAALAAYERILPVLLFMNQAMQTAVLGLLSTGGTPLTGMYQTVSCDDVDTCSPEFVEDPFTGRRVARGVTEPYSATGDPDDDGLTNLEEYTNNEAKGGDDLDFAVAAASDQLDGTAGSGGSGGGCFIATAAYGTPLASELDALRSIRDRALLTSSAGGAFVDAYYRSSPAIAAWIAHRPAARAAVRVALLPFTSGRAAFWAAGLLVVCAAAAASRRVRKPVAVSRE